ncbi:MAG: MerR family DNA-binding transcriptional regulator [Pseudomonadota bacterium]
MSKTYTITELAEEFGITTRAIRFYEDKGLVSPARQGQARIYDHRDKVRLTFIVRGRRVGLTLAEIRELFDLYDITDGREVQYRAARRKFEERIAILDSQKNEIDAAIGDLQSWVSHIDETLERLRANPTPEGTTPNRVIGYGVAPVSETN